ncbi:hypothetical protein CR513_04716, partial [Mucuna pruriens]
MSILMHQTSILSLNEIDKKVDQISYKVMIDSLLYLTVSRQGIIFNVCLCARFQYDPRESHLIAAKRRYYNRNRIYLNNSMLLTTSMNQASIGSNISLLCDNTTAINLSKNLILHSRAMHIEIKHHFIREYVQKGILDLKFISSE